MSTATPAHLFAGKAKSEKEALEHSHVTKIFPNRGQIFRNKLRNTWTAILKILKVSKLFYLLYILRLVLYVFQKYGVMSYNFT